MGDKSPRSNDRKKKQSAAKKEREAATHAKAHPAPILPSREKGK